MTAQAAPSLDAPTADPGAPAVLGPKKARREESDRRMIEAAIGLIAERGSIGASVAEIGARAGYSRGLPTQRFGSKLQLLEAVVDAMESWFNKAVARRTRGLGGLDALAARVRLQIETVRANAGSSVAMYNLVVESAAAVPELRPRVQRLHDGYRANMEGYLREAEAAGELREGVDPAQVARELLGAISGLCLQALIDDDAERLERDAEHLVRGQVLSLRRPAQG